VKTERKISSASDFAIKDETTVALDFGRITVDEDLVLYLFGTPGQRRFDFMWEILSEGMLGFIVMVDSTRPETFREARNIMSTFKSYARTPFVVAANKQDHDDAWEPGDMKIVLRLNSKTNRRNGDCGSVLAFKRLSRQYLHPSSTVRSIIFWGILNQCQQALDLKQAR